MRGRVRVVAGVGVCVLVCGVRVLSPAGWRLCALACVRVVARGGACALLRAWSRARACVGWFGVWVCVGGPRLCARPPLGGVLWRFPTLPHPLGCSTIGAAGLSFQVRNVAGRFPGAVTTTRLCRPPPPFVGPPCGGVSWPAVWWVGWGGWVGRGSYSGCGSSIRPLLPFFVAVCWPVFVGPAGVGGVWLPVPPVLAPFLVSGAGGPWPSPFCGGARRLGGWVPGLGGLVWCRPISTSRLASASRRFHLWPIDPLFWRGPLTPCGGVETSSRSGLPA